MKKHLLLLLCLLTTSTLLLHAQIEERGTPISFTKSQLSTSIPQVIMPTETIDIPKLLAEDDLDMMENQPLRFAHRFDVNYHLQNSGQWETLANGDRIWRLEIWSPGAVNINIAYRKFRMPKGGKFYVYDSDRDMVIGAFTERNNRPDGYFTTRLIHDDKVTLEYFEPAAVAGQGALEIMTVAHGYRHLDGRTAAEKAGACQVNVTCPEGIGWEDQKKGVARILMDNAFLCSGTLINNTANDCRPLFSTANHCVMAAGHDAAGPNALVPLYTFYWNYECPCGTDDDSCNANDFETTAGGTVIVSSGGSGQGVGGLDLEYGDFALIELSESPVDAGYDVYFNGWDRNGNPDGTGYLPQALTGIHHPGGDQKKISTDFSGLNNVGAPTTVEDGQYWQLFWEATQSGHAVTEGGSSGSPLFDSQTQLVIGQLFGGSSVNCDEPALDRGVYGGFFYSWTNSDNITAAALPSVRTLAPHLDPIGAGTAMSHGGSAMPCSDPPVIIPKVSFTSLETKTTEASIIDEPNDCLDYQEFNIGIRVSHTPDVAVPITLSITDNGTNPSDYELMTTSVTLSDNSAQNITVRVFDDFIVESTESFELNYTIDAGYLGNAIPGSLNQAHTITVEDNDLNPEVAGNTIETILSDDFEDQTASEELWTVESGDLHLFYVGRSDQSGDLTGNSAFVSPTGVLIQYAYTTAPDDATLFYTEVDATDKSAVTVNFDWSSGGEGESTPYDFGTVVISMDDGANYTTVSDVLNLSDGPVSTSLTLPEIVNGTTFRLGFKWQHDGNAGDATPIAFDNIVVTGLSVGAAEVATQMTTTSSEANVGPNSTVHFYDTDGTIMATIKNNDSHDFGCTTIEIDRAGNSAETYWGSGSEITTKTFRVVPENASANKSWDVTLYYKDTEIDGWVMDNTNESAASNLKMIQGDQAIGSEDGTGATTQTPASVAYNTSDFAYTATFMTPSSTEYGYALGEVTASDALAVELVDLTATPLENTIVLSWTTLSETDNAGFEIYRSTNPIEGFEKIAFQAGQGTTKEAQQYQYVDTKVNTEQRYYYQIHQVDNSGNATQSTVVHAKLQRTEVALAVQPNPVSTNLQVQLNADRLLTGELRVVNLLGQEVYRTAFSHTDALNTTINTNSFTAGVYLLQVVADGELIQSEKFVKR